MICKLVKFDSDEAVDILKLGGILAFPTETVFGLAVRYDSKDAFEDLVRVKLRRPDKPFTLMCPVGFNLNEVAYISKAAQRVIDHFLPGPLTVLLKARESVPDYVTLKQPTIGIRISGQREVSDLIQKVGVPLLVPSANKANEVPAKSSDDVMKVFVNEINGCVIGRCGDGIPSTIVDISTDSIKLIRQGGLNFENIKKVWEEE